MDLNILHLSDLHISPKFDTSQKILDDIKEQIIDLHDIVIVVTGDIIDQGNYDPVTKNNVLSFFENLSAILGEKFKGCFIVPGNHDKSQSTSGNILTTSFSKEEGLLLMPKEDWNYQLLAYENFLRLEDDIYKKLYAKKEMYSLISHSDTYGVEAYQNHESTIIFIKLDTSWCSLGGEKDKRNLRISKTQLDTLTEEYKRIYEGNKHKKVFTITLCHHPLNWLTESDESMVYSYLTNNDYLNTDVLLCGHTHDVDIQNLFSPTHQITTLVTGIGWSERTPAEKRSGHRYSIYIFNLRKNSCEIIIRKTDLRGNFDIDRDFFPDSESKNKGRLLLPILPRNSHPFIKIPTCSQKELLYTPLFIDNAILENIKVYNQKLSKLRIHLTEFVSLILRNCIDDFQNVKNISEQDKQDLLKNYFYNNVKTSSVIEIFKKNNSKIYILFTSLLYEICNRFIILYKEYWDKNENIRILFRLYNQEYKQICYQSKSHIELEDYNKTYIHKDDLARNLNYDGIIEKSFKYDTALVYSSNQWYNTFEPDRWNNYICIVPQYNDMKLFYDTKKQIQIPYILCTISIKSEKNTIFLDLLNYIGIKECISDIIESFIKLFNIDINMYCDYMTHEKYIK